MQHIFVQNFIHSNFQNHKTGRNLNRTMNIGIINYDDEVI